MLEQNQNLLTLIKVFVKSFALEKKSFQHINEQKWSFRIHLDKGKRVFCTYCMQTLLHRYEKTFFLNVCIIIFKGMQ